MPQLVTTNFRLHNAKQFFEAFSEAGSLRMHMITHTGEKVHKCAECRAGNLKSHMYSPTVKRRHTRTHNAIMHAQKQKILEDTWKYIPYKSQINANGASTP